MTSLTTAKSIIENHLGCFGEFDAEDNVCSTRCALSIRCCIERDESLRIELLEDLMESDATSIRDQ